MDIPADGALGKPETLGRGIRNGLHGDPLPWQNRNQGLLASSARKQAHLSNNP
jgi:hypothetical protein